MHQMFMMSQKTQLLLSQVCLHPEIAEYRSNNLSKERDVSISKLIKPDWISKFEEQPESPNKLAKIRRRVEQLKQEKQERLPSSGEKGD